MTTTTRSLRPYQAEDVEKVRAAWARGIARPAIVSATGTGKSSIIASLAVDEAHSGGHVLILAHRGELLTQIKATCRAFDPSVHVGRVQATTREHSAPVIVATVQTMARLVRDGSPRLRRPTLLICDEGHHSAAPTWERVMRWAGCYDDESPTRALGVTATMDRAEKRGLGLGDVWQEIVAERSIIWGIEQEWLVPLQGVTVIGEHVDLTRAKISAATKDYADADLGEMVSQDAPEIVKAWWTHAALPDGSHRQTAAFVPTIAAAEAYVQAFRDAGIAADLVTGKTPHKVRGDVARRTGTYGRLADGRIQVLVSVGVLTEGFDAPPVSCIVVARPTQLDHLYQQCFDDDTEALTPQGWRYGRDLSVGDTVSAFDPETGEVRWEPVTAYTRRPLGTGEHMFTLRSPTTDLRVTGGHRMVYAVPSGRARRWSPWQVTTAAELAERRSDWRLPVAGREKFSGVALSDAEVALIGWVQTDGCVNRANGVLTIAQQDPDNCAEIERVLTDCGVKWRVQVHREPTNYGPRAHPLRVYRVSRGQPRGTDTHLRGWGYLAPWIPKDDGDAWHRLDDLDDRQWAILLDAMHRANGAKQQGQYWTRRSYHLCTPSRDMAEWLQAGCMRRGWRANLAVTTDDRDVPVWTLHCREVGWRAVGGANQADREHLEQCDTVPGEMVWCVSVPSGALLTRRHGKGSIMGNCVGRGTRPMDPAAWPRHDGAPFAPKRDCLVLDVVGMAPHVSLRTLVRLVPGAPYRGRPCDVCGQPRPCGCIADTPEPTEPRTDTRRRLTGPAEYAPIDLLAGARESGLNWLRTVPQGGYEGIPFLRAGRYYGLLWHNEDGTWSGGWVTAKGAHDGDWVIEGVPFDDARDAVEELELLDGGEWVPLTELAERRDQPWRLARKSASAAQQRLAASLGVPDPHTLTSGACSDEIERVLATRRLVDTF